MIIIIIVVVVVLVVYRAATAAAAAAAANDRLTLLCGSQCTGELTLGSTLGSSSHSGFSAIVLPLCFFSVVVENNRGSGIFPPTLPAAAPVFGSSTEQSTFSVPASVVPLLKVVLLSCPTLSLPKT